MSSDSAVNRASDPHLLAADLVDAAKDRYLKVVERFLQAGGAIVLLLMFFESLWPWLWFAIPILIVGSAVLYYCQLHRWWRWASAHDIDPEFLLGAAREEELSVPRWLITARGR